MGYFSRRQRIFSISISLVFVAGCSLAPLGSGAPSVKSPARSLGASPPAIQHLIVVVQQDRTFDDLFSGFPGADAPRYGCKAATSASGGSTCPPGDTRIPLKAVRLDARPCALSSSFADYFSIAWNDGKMDGWNHLDPKNPDCPYTHVAASDTEPYWALAKRFALADHLFASTRFGLFPDQLYMIAGTTQITPAAWVVGPPAKAPWGCDAPAGSRTTLLKHEKILLHRGPFPCFTQFATMANLLDDAGVTWKYYFTAGAGDFNPFEAIRYVFEGPDWKTNMSSPATNVFSDVANGNLAAISWVLAPHADSDAPATRGGPRWVSSLVRAVMKSRYWSSTAVVVVWDNEGAGRYYDSVAPPQLDEAGLGFRVPMIVVSPYAKRGYVSHTEYEFGSLLKFIEENWNLPPLGGYATDRRANSIANMFDFGR
jgi:phospholipase C